MKKHASDLVKVKFNTEHSHPERLTVLQLFPTFLQQEAVHVSAQVPLMVLNWLQVAVC